MREEGGRRGNRRKRAGVGGISARRGRRRRHRRRVVVIGGGGVRAACGNIGQAQLANASTERPQTKKGGVGVAMRTYGRCINKRAAFFSRAPPAQKATCAVRRLARRRRRKFAASHQPANFPEEIRPR